MIDGKPCPCPGITCDCTIHTDPPGPSTVMTIKPNTVTEAKSAREAVARLILDTKVKIDGEVAWKKFPDLQRYCLSYADEILAAIKASGEYFKVSTKPLIETETIEAWHARVTKAHNDKYVKIDDLLSEEAIHRFNVADYRLRHNARYYDWSDEKRLKYKIQKLIAAAKERGS